MQRQLRFLSVMLLVSLLGTGSLLYLYEHGSIPQVRGLGDAAWWWLVTSATVGYGDIFPMTTGGRVAGVVAILIGIYCYTNFVTLTAESLNGFANRERFGNAPFKGSGHIVICEYTAFADEMIQVLPGYPELAGRKAVMVTDLVAVQPYPHIHFVRGVPISPVALHQASISTAAYIFVFANIRFVDPDLKTLHCVSRIRKLAPKAKIFMELNEPEHELAWHLGGDITILKSRDMLKSVLGTGLDLSASFAPAKPAGQEKPV
ncbi:MAG: hypothetical protein HY302_09655 [Opitutae bacterium]|nr:hypothetical protein [Opitutae bacterium]